MGTGADRQQARAKSRERPEAEAAGTRHRALKAFKPAHISNINDPNQG